MKNAIVCLTALLVLSASIESASTQNHPRLTAVGRAMYKVHFDALKEMVIYDEQPLFENQHRPRPMSRAEMAVATRFFLYILDADINPHIGLEENYYERYGVRRNLLPDRFWHVEFLMREFAWELAGIGADLEEMWSKLSKVRESYTDLGIELRDPYNERFTDVPDGHWADEAIHNLRRAGILYGYPDGTYRGE